MHKKQLGSIGELAVAKMLMQKGYSVFTELGDLSRVDLIVLIGKDPIKLQVKAITEKNGKIDFSLRKHGPSYRYKYCKDDVDLFCIYIQERDLVLYVSWKDLEGRENCIIRLSNSKNGQKKRCNFFEQFTDFERALRDYTGCTLTQNGEGEEIVQTTKSNNSASES